MKAIIKNMSKLTKRNGIIKSVIKLIKQIWIMKRLSRLLRYVPKNKYLPDLLKRNEKIKQRYWRAALVAVLCLSCVTPAFAASDPLSIINNLSEFIFSIIKALGVIILLWGIVQVGISIQSHDASQRTQGFLCLLGGLLITFAKEILATIGAI